MYQVCLRKSCPTVLQERTHTYADDLISAGTEHKMLANPLIETSTDTLLHVHASINNAERIENGPVVP